MAMSYGQGSPLAPSRGYQLFITALVMVIVAALFVFARLWTRISIKRLGSDDYLVIAALISSIFLTATINRAVIHGYGTRSSDLTPLKKKLALKWFFIAQSFYKLVVGFTKAAIVCLYIRIFISRNFQRVCYGVLAAVTVWTIAALLATVLQCLPIEASWDKSVKDPRCINKNAFWYGFAVTNTSLDFILLFLPIQPILRLHLHWKEKVGLLGVFALGAFVCITSIVRTTAVAHTTTGPRKDITWDFISRSVWTLIEANTGIICACLPILKGPLARLFPRLFKMSTTKESGRPYASVPKNSLALNPRSLYGASGKQATIGSNSSGQRGKPKGQFSSWASSDENILEPNDEGQLGVSFESGIMMKREIDVSYESEVESPISFQRTEIRT